MIDYKHKKRNCTKCKKIKSFKKFRWDYRRDIPKAICIECDTDYHAEYHKKKYVPVVWRRNKECN